MELLLNHLVKNFLIEKLKNNDVLNQSLLFWGEPDLGKLTTAKAFAKSILCQNKIFNGCNNCDSCKAFDNSWNPDYLLVDTTSDSLKVDDLLPITDFLIFKPQFSKKKVLIINNCEKLNITTQSSLLKMLEEPKNDFLIILVTSNPQKLLKTIKSRVMPIRFIKPTKEELITYINQYYPNKIQDLPYLLDLAENRPANIFNFIKDKEILKEKEKNLQMYKNICKTNFIQQSNLIKDLLAPFSKQETKDQTSTDISVKTYLKSLVNDWLSSIERDLQLLVSSNSKPEILKQKKKQLKNTLQLLTYIDSYNANYRLLLETFCLTTF